MPGQPYCMFTYTTDHLTQDETNRADNKPTSSHLNPLQLFQGWEPTGNIKGGKTSISSLPPVSLYPSHPQRQDGGRQAEREAGRGGEAGEARRKEGKDLDRKISANTTTDTEKMWC